MCKVQILRKTLQCKWWYSRKGTFFFNKYSSVIYWQIVTKLHSLYCIRGRCKYRWKYRKIRQMEPEIQLTSYFHPPIKCPWLLTDRNQTHMHGKWKLWSFRKMRPMEAEIQSNMYCVLQVNISYLLTERNQTYTLESAKCEVSGKSFWWNPG